MTLSKEWLTAAELAALALPGLPGTPRNIKAQAAREDWRTRTNSRGEPLARRRRGRGGGWEYHHTLLPLAAQATLVQALGTAEDEGPRDEAPRAAAKAGLARGEAWAWFERLPESRKREARRRLEALDAVAAVQRSGCQKNVAVQLVAAKVGTSPSTLYNWCGLVAGLDRGDWLAHLAPRHAGRSKTADCDPMAWEFLKADWLRVERPSLESCYARLQEAARAEGWQIPSARTLQRRLEREIPAPVIVYLREGSEALRRMYPPQERDRSAFHALEAVNIDGHKWDVFVRWPDGSVGRPIMAAIQDLYSNKCLAWRVDRTENADLVRLAFADLFRVWGLPDRCYMDNGRGFAAKCISGGTPNRYRFKVRADEPSGILTTLGIEVNWTRPYSGQSKPIERMFRDFCDGIAKHPAFAGAYTGNKPDAKPENYGSKAVPIETFLAVVTQGIRLHNAKAKRNTRVCQRVKSFDQAFAESYADAPIRKATAEQLQMCLLAAESVRADRRSGAIRLLGNRYWAECLHDWTGKPVTVRFDPERLHEGIWVYRPDGAYVGYADCLEAVGFADTQEARGHARKIQRFQRATREAAEAERQLSTDELLRLLPEIDEPEPPESRIARPIFGGSGSRSAQALAVKPAAAAEADAQAEAREAAFFEQIARGLRLVQDAQE